MFHDIFKKLKTGKRKGLIKPANPKIIADIHEKNSLVIACLHELRCDVEMKKLHVGDYIVGGVVIERKTFSDFVSSMINRRLIQQLRNLQQYEKSLLIIENFDLNTMEKDRAGGLNPNALRGFILSISLNYKIPIIFTEDSHETALYLSTLAKQQITPRTEISLHSRIPKTEQEQKIYILESFCNIGPKTAKKLLKKFKTLSAVFNAKEEELKEVLKSRTKNFKKILEY